jgi:hypothetical protein
MEDSDHLGTSNKLNYDSTRRTYVFDVIERSEMKIKLKSTE